MILPFLAAAAAATAPPPLAAPLPPTIAWHGASESLVARPDDPWITPAEARNFEETPTYDQTRQWLEGLAAASPLLRVETFGRTAQGRDLILVRASKGGPIRKPVVLAQAGIHSGEIDGKDAGLMLLRDIALRGKDSLLDRAEFVFVPVFNADGHERSSPYNRPNQRGPNNQGWRTTAQNLNLNRDYLKADTPEMKAMISLLRREQPSLYLDLHVTDGVDYQYDVTMMFPGWDGRYAHSPAIGQWLDKAYRPAVEEALARAGHIPGPYIDALDGRHPLKGVRYFADQPRYSTGYADLARIPSVLVELHSLKPYKQRVLGTYVLLEESLRVVGAEGPQVAAAIASDRASRPATDVMTWRELKQPSGVIPDFKGVAFETYRSPASGGLEVRWLGKPVTRRMPYYLQVPDKVSTLPAAWWVPATEPHVIDLLRLHGIEYQILDRPRALSLDMVRLGDVAESAADEGHMPIKVGKFAHSARIETMPAGSVRVPSDQPLGLLAAAMLEPENLDSLLLWNFFPAILMRTEYIEGYAIAPLSEGMLKADPELKRAFEVKLKSDKTFARDPDARLQWFYERTPYYDERYLLYPVGRELKRYRGVMPLPWCNC